MGRHHRSRRCQLEVGIPGLLAGRRPPDDGHLVAAGDQMELGRFGRYRQHELVVEETLGHQRLVEEGTGLDQVFVLLGDSVAVDVAVAEEPRYRVRQVGADARQLGRIGESERIARRHFAARHIRSDRHWRGKHICNCQRHLLARKQVRQRAALDES